MNTLQLDKNGTTYLFRYAPGGEDEVVGQLIRMAEDDSYDLDWLDAATLSFEVVRRAACRYRTASDPAMENLD
jgi:hypothetical protein